MMVTEEQRTVVKLVDHVLLVSLQVLPRQPFVFVEGFI